MGLGSCVCLSVCVCCACAVYMLCTCCDLVLQPKHDVTVIDAPGHRHFIKNAITGVAQVPLTRGRWAVGGGRWAVGVGGARAPPAHDSLVTHPLRWPRVSPVSQADSAVLVVSAATGELEANLSPSGQAREHTLLANTLGVKRLIVAVNKMDLATPPFSQERFDEVKKKVSVLVKACGYSPKATTFVPVCGWGGDNLDDKSGKMAW